MCSWMASVFTLSDDMILRKCGIDAIQYIRSGLLSQLEIIISLVARFQRHLIVFVFIITVICTTIILPINFTMGNIQGDKTKFGHTTISNLPAQSNVLWVHIVIGILFMPCGIFIMRKFSVSLRMESEEENSVSSRTLMLDGIPREYCKKDYIIRHFQEAYPHCEIDDVQIAYSVAKLSSLHERLEASQRALVFCENYQLKSGASLEMSPHWCGLLCSAFPCCPTSNVSATEFYREQVNSVKQSLQSEKAHLQSNAIGIAFVTFSNLTDAKNINADHRKIVNCLRSSPPSSSLDSLLKPGSWDLRFAPTPEDIYWENLNRRKSFRSVNYDE